MAIVDKHGKVDADGLQQAINEKYGNRPDPPAESADQGGAQSEPTPEVEASPEPEVPVQEPKIELNDEMAFQYLSGKLGREIKSVDDLIEVREKEVERVVEKSVYDEELDTLAEWKKKTNRPISDYYKTQRNFEEMESTDRVREFLQDQYPNMNQDDISYMLQDQFLKYQNPTEDDDFSSDDIRRAEIKFKQLDQDALNHFNKIKSDYLSPVQQEAQRAAQLRKEQTEAWDANIQQTFEQLTDLKIGEHTYSLQDKDKWQQSFTTPEKVMTLFQDDKGAFNYDKLVHTVLSGLMADKIVSSAQNQAAATATKEIVDELKQTDLNPKVNKQPVQKDKNIEQVENYIANLGKRYTLKG